MIQGSAEWFAARLGKVTASRIADVCAKTRNGYGCKRDDYMAELIVERLTGAPVEHYVTAAMQRGTDLEPEARSAYCFAWNCDVEQVGFIEHPSIRMAGASPDGYVGTDGMVEIKCPNTATHIAMLLGAPIDDRYIKQMQWQMACARRDWCHFISYDNRLPAAMSLHVELVTRDDALIGKLEAEVVAFLDELDSKIAQLNARFSDPPAQAESPDGIPDFLRRAS